VSKYVTSIISVVPLQCVCKHSASTNLVDKCNKRGVRYTKYVAIFNHSTYYSLDFQYKNDNNSYQLNNVVIVMDLQWIIKQEYTIQPLLFQEVFEYYI